MAGSGWSSPALGALLVVVSAGAVRAQARVAQLHVAVAKGSCPSAAQLNEALTPVIPHDTVLMFDDAPSAQLGRRASVIDAGDRYTIEIDGARREVEDPRRDCTDRARVASVFIALNLSPPNLPLPLPLPLPATATSTSSTSNSNEDDTADADADADEPSTPPPDRSGIGLILFGVAAHSTEAERTAFGAGAGAYLATYSFRFELSASVLAPVEIALQPSGAIRGRVQLTRVPIALGASYLLSVGDFQLGPTAGLVLDVLLIEGEGEGLERPQSALRLNPGALLGLEAQLWVSARVGLWVRPQLRVFPRAYRLAVDPTGTLGESPRLWLGAQLGVEARSW